MRSEYVEVELSPFRDFFLSSQISLIKVDVDVGGRAAHLVLKLTLLRPRANNEWPTVDMGAAISVVSLLFMQMTGSDYTPSLNHGFLTVRLMI